MHQPVNEAPSRHLCASRVRYLLKWSYCESSALGCETAARQPARHAPLGQVSQICKSALCPSTPTTAYWPSWSGVVVFTLWAHFATKPNDLSFRSLFVPFPVLHICRLVSHIRLARPKYPSKWPTVRFFPHCLCDAKNVKWCQKQHVD